MSDAVVAAVDSASSRGPEESEQSVVNRLDHALAAKAIADIALFLGRGSNQHLTIQDVLPEMQSLSSALKDISQVSKQDVQRDSSTARPHHNKDSSGLKTMYCEEVERLKGTQERTLLEDHKDKVSFFIDSTCIQSRYRPYDRKRSPIFRFKFCPDSERQPRERVIRSNHDEHSIYQIAEWAKAQRHWEQKPEILAYWCPPEAVN